MKKIEEINSKLIEFDKQVGWDDLQPEKANQLAQLLVGEAVELMEAISHESHLGLNKYDVALEVADVYIYLQKICLALDIDLLESVEDKMLINKARFLTKDYQQQILSPQPKKQRFYKINNCYSEVKVKDGSSLVCGKLLGVRNQLGSSQDVYVIDEKLQQPIYLKQIVAIVIPRNNQAPIWIAADHELSVTEVDQKLKLVDYLYDIEIV